MSVDHEATLRVCDLLGGTCSARPLDLHAAGPEDVWCREIGEWGEDEDDEEDVDAFRGRTTTRAREIASALTVGRIDDRPVVITGGGRFDLSGPDLETMGGAVRVWDLRTGRKLGRTLTGHGLGVASLATVATDQGLIAVSDYEEGELGLELTRGELVAALQVSHNGGMGAGLVAGRPVAVTGGSDDFVEVWDLLDGERLGRALTGIKPMVRAFGVVEVDGRTVVAAGGDGDALHLRNLDGG
ncbi:hypothetical protein E1265_19375 [Streptomyces sp. 8K308]|uniref:WD40 repeat domain-containing protein n=1 Tax=Streptomyces sp. 8K308 TaxID=2530388 RepID=UPI001050E229|nr:hypothetical protein [Streptomyces sp. 8K308]TDC20991.1 hypothetical protein E1265_19375 [Streptomyces sp. 8K308]